LDPGVKVTDTWLISAIAKNRGKDKYRVTVSRGPARAGLMVTVYGDGTAAFVMRYTRPSGARVFMPIGAYGKAGLSLADACATHDAALSLLEKGGDPKDERERLQSAAEESRRERAGADTVASLVEQFVHRKLRAERWDAEAGKWVRDSRANIRARKRPQEAAALLGYAEQSAVGQKRRGRRKAVATLISELGNRKARDVTRRQLIALLDAIVQRGAPVTANRVHALLAQLFTWAAAKDLISASPMAGVERPGGEERPRQRVLSAEEVKAFWTKLATADMAEPTRLALKLLLVTAQRRGELTFAKWAHFDLDGKLWTIPAELLKSSHARRAEPEPHLVPLSPLALKLLDELKALTGEGTYVLPAHADKRKNRSYCEWVLSRAVRKNATQFGIPHFTPHDLRRTAASFMTKLRVPRLHVEKVLNHATGDIAEVYDRHDYLREKRVALEKWGRHLATIIEDKEQEIVPMVRHA
jgi:integrase